MMRTRLLSIVAFLALAIYGADARGFLPVGGFTPTSHYALETMASGFISANGTVLSHGSLPVAATYTSGVESVNDGEKSDISFLLSSDGLTLLVEGAADGCRCQIFGIDGRMLADFPLHDGAVDIARYPAGHYLLRLLPQGEAPAIHHFLKRDR